MFHGILIGLGASTMQVFTHELQGIGIGLIIGAVLGGWAVYTKSRKAIAAGKEYLGRAKAQIDAAAMAEQMAEQKLKAQAKSLVTKL